MANDTQPLDMPDGPGWWAYETKDKRKGVIGIDSFRKEGNFVFMRWSGDDYEMKYTFVWFKTFMGNATFWRVYMPWERAPQPPDGDPALCITALQRMAEDSRQLRIDLGHTAADELLARIPAAVKRLQQLRDGTQPPADEHSWQYRIGLKLDDYIPLQGMDNWQRIEAAIDLALANE